jgi:hypothetical protein
MSLVINTVELQQRITECGDPDALANAASGMAAVASTMATSGDEIATSWERLSGCYFAPETGHLVAAIEPIRPKTHWVDQTVAGVNGALGTLAGALGKAKPKLEELLREGNKFNAWARAHPGWESSSASFYKEPTGGRKDHYVDGTGLSFDAVRQWHDRIVSDIEETTRELATAELACYESILDSVGVNPAGAPDERGGGARADDVPWQVQVLNNEHPFGELWIDKGPIVDRISVGILKSIANGASALSSLVGISYNWNPVTGGGTWDLGAHVAGESWWNMGKLALATNALSVLGAVGLAGTGHDGALKAIGRTYQNAWSGISGAGLPGGWAVRGGYLFGNVAQAAIPGPGKAGALGVLGRVGEMEGEGALKTAAAAGARSVARGIELGGKGGWLLGDVRLTSHLLGLDEKLADRLHNLTPVRTLSEQLTGLKVRLGGRDAPALVADRVHQLSTEQHRLRQDVLDHGQHLADQARSERAAAESAAGRSAASRRALDGLRAHVDAALPRDRAIRAETSYLEHESGHLVAARDRDGGRVAAPVYGPHVTGPGVHADPVIRMPAERGAQAFHRALRAGDPDHLFVRHGRHDVVGDEYVGLRTVRTAAGTHQEVFFAHEVDGRAVETVFGVVRDGRVVQLATPRSYLAGGRALDLSVPVPKPVRELYHPQLKESAWEAVPGHNLREGAAAAHEGREAAEEREEHERGRESAERWEGAAAAHEGREAAGDRAEFDTAEERERRERTDEEHKRRLRLAELWERIEQGLGRERAGGP